MKILVLYLSEHKKYEKQRMSTIRNDSKQSSGDNDHSFPL
jgi:hypothetical protein